MTTNVIAIPLYLDLFLLSDLWDINQRRRRIRRRRPRSSRRSGRRRPRRTRRRPTRRTRRPRRRPTRRTRRPRRRPTRRTSRRPTRGTRRRPTRGTRRRFTRQANPVRLRQAQQARRFPPCRSPTDRNCNYARQHSRGGPGTLGVEAGIRRGNSALGGEIHSEADTSGNAAARLRGNVGPIRGNIFANANARNGANAGLNGCLFPGFCGGIRADTNGGSKFTWQLPGQQEMSLPFGRRRRRSVDPEE